LKVLFVCSANKDRSATAEEYAREAYSIHKYDAAGTNHKLCFKYGTQYITEELLVWADLVLAMENKHKKEILKQVGTGPGNKIKIFGIRDHFEFGNPELKEILKEKLQAY
jgi:predicted protein tyrosine phosphatase